MTTCFINLDLMGKNGCNLMLVDSAATALSGVKPEQAWRQMKAFVGVTADDKSIALFNRNYLVFTEASYMDNATMHFAATHEPEMLEALLANGKFIITGFSGDTENIASTFGAMISKGFFWSSVEMKTECPKGSKFEDVYEQLPEKVVEPLQELFDLAVCYGYGPGQWSKGPFLKAEEIFSAEELVEIGLDEANATNRTLALERMQSAGWSTKQIVEKFARYNHGVITQHFCNGLWVPNQ